LCVASIAGMVQSCVDVLFAVSIFKLKAPTSSFQNANATTKACRIYGERNQAADRYADRAQAQFRFVTMRPAWIGSRFAFRRWPIRQALL